MSVRLSVCLSVCPVDRPQQWRAAGLLLGAVRAGDSVQQQRRRISKCGQCHVHSGRSMLYTDCLRVRCSVYPRRLRHVLLEPPVLPGVLRRCAAQRPPGLRHHGSYCRVHEY